MSFILACFCLQVHGLAGEIGLTVAKVVRGLRQEQDIALATLATTKRTNQNVMGRLLKPDSAKLTSATDTVY